MSLDTANIVRVFNQMVFSEFSHFAAFTIVLFSILGAFYIILRFLYFLVSPYLIRSHQHEEHLFDARRISFRVLVAGAFLMTSLIAAFLCISAIAIFLNALWMAVSGTAGLLKASEILYAPRTDAFLHILLALLYAVLAGGAVLSAYALWPFRRDWIAWNDVFQEQGAQKFAQNASKVFVVQTFAFTNVAAVFFAVLLVYHFIIVIAEGLRDPMQITPASEDARVQPLLILSAIVIGNGIAAFSLWPLRRGADS